MRTAMILLTGVCALALAPIAPSRAATLYHLTDLGTLGGPDSWADAINASGTVVGGSATLPAGSPAMAYAYAGGAMSGLGTLGGLSLAMDINNAGVVVGRSDLAGGGSISRAFRWDQTQGMVDLGTLGGAQAGATGIDSTGNIVGWSVTTGGQAHAAYRPATSGPWRDLGTLGGHYSVALGINDSGQIVGISTDTPTGPLKATYWSSPTSAPVNIGTLGGGVYAEALAISNNGVIVGYSYLAGNLIGRPFSFSAGVMTDLGHFGGSFGAAYGVNDAGVIVGSARDPLNAELAFVYAGGVMTDLNTVVQVPAGWRLRTANDVNNNGEIAAQMFNPATSTYHAVLLTPVPEPASLMLCIVGGLGVLWRVRGQRRRP